MGHEGYETYVTLRYVRSTISAKRRRWPPLANSARPNRAKLKRSTTTPRSPSSSPAGIELSLAAVSSLQLQLQKSHVKPSQPRHRVPMPANGLKRSRQPPAQTSAPTAATALYGAGLVVRLQIADSPRIARRARAALVRSWAISSGAACPAHPVGRLAVPESSSPSPCSPLY